MNFLRSFLSTLLLVILNILFCNGVLLGQSNRDSVIKYKESDFYNIKDVLIPQDIYLEVGGIAALPDGRLAVCTRRGEVWLISDPEQKNGPAGFKLFAQGLHEPLGIAFYKGDLYVVQRPELTRLRDLDGDGLADEYKTVYSFELSGNYHEYAYGPVFDKNGNAYVNLNLGWFRDHMESKVKWRGWILKIGLDGKMTPFAAGMRSPAGLAIDSAGNIFYSENQGRWVGSGFVTKIDYGDFLGHPASLKWDKLPGTPSIDLDSADIPNTGEPEFEVAKKIKGLKTPSVWLPHGILGISTSGLLLDNSGQLGPFEGQYFVGDEGMSVVNRLYLEKINGVYQGASFPFLKDFSSGVFRLEWGSSGNLFVGMTARGWGSAGGAPFGLQRVNWNGRVPFEIKSINAIPNGFRLNFTKKVDKEVAQNLGAYSIDRFTYKYHYTYGSPIINREACKIREVKVSADGLSVDLAVDNLKEGYIHEIKAAKVVSSLNEALLHDVGYYTLNSMPKGSSRIVVGSADKVQKHERTRMLGSKEMKKDEPNVKSQNENIISEDRIFAMLGKYTCSSCHDPKNRKIGPSFRDIAKKKYSVDKIVELIKSPQPEHWPGYATPMPPFGSTISNNDLIQIATWIEKQ